ncbi:hypothetical protein [Leuconostoc gelidum]|uniref:hypothetical protein n=1 Tax=Leuconostoc gelidum TaxID=1244 RepID=UPI001C7D957D|nr:hypothetical protein [Leuconostoc gelidum]MBZ6008261.1 hypothetical protein [Leuconostoc gelidum subsp. aenigmaticum]MBZ6009768.1 hypothetical protein [Leuconostoc gelidum subsp. aenigmaticum]
MIETQYMNKMLNDDIIVFEVSDGWFLGVNGLTQLNIASPQGAVSYIDDRYEGFYRELDWTYNTVQLTANPLAAMQFESSKDGFAQSILTNFPSGTFKNVSLKAKITDTPVE